MRTTYLAAALAISLAFVPSGAAAPVPDGVVGSTCIALAGHASEVTQTVNNTTGFGGIHFGAICYALGAHADNLTARVNDAVGEAGDQPGTFVVAELEEEVCANRENLHCRAMDGRPITAGQFEMCSPGTATVHRVLYETTAVLDAAMDDATTMLFAGTPLEGERICEEHWSTLYALTSLP